MLTFVLNYLLVPTFSYNFRIQIGLEKTHLKNSW
jgi:hypothetical protein